MENTKKILGERDSLGSCRECNHIYYEDNLSVCKAFPKGIPRELYWNAHSHTSVLPEQEGDYVFEMNEHYKKRYERYEKRRQELESRKQKEQVESDKKSFWNRLFKK